MAIYSYEKKLTVSSSEEISLKIELPDQGSTSHHIIDIPGPQFFSRVDSVTQQLGKGEDLKEERTLVISTPINVDPDNDTIRIKYSINDEEILNVERPKAGDLSPVVKLSIYFKMR
jgi:hypothetical protein